MKLYLLRRSKGDYVRTLLCANYQTVLDALSGLDGTDESILIDFIPVADVTTKPKK